MKKSVRRKRPRHAFRFKIGKKIITHWAKMIPAKRDVFIPLKAAHVQRSMDLEGVGNTQTCTMAVCALDNAECFPAKSRRLHRLVLPSSLCCFTARQKRCP